MSSKGTFGLRHGSIRFHLGLVFEAYRKVVAGLLVLALFQCCAGFGATLTVTSLADSGGGSLRQAIIDAAPGDTINFSVTGTITLASTLTISKNLTISGPGASNLAISGNNSVGVIVINPGITAMISSVTIENGNVPFDPDSSGGVQNRGTLTLSNSTLSGNSAGYAGGGIHNSGTLSVTNSTLSANSAGFFGGGIFNSSGGTMNVTNSTLSANSALDGGGILNDFGSATLSSSTLTNNSASIAGGGIYNEGGMLTVSNSTFSGNSAIGFSGGGIFNGGGTTTISNGTLSGNTASTPGGGIFNLFGTLMVKNSIVANSGSAGNCSNAITRLGVSTITSQGHNLSDDATCSSFFNQTGDTNGIAAGLDPAGLQNNGGPTQTIALLATSPAKDAIPVSDCSVSTDQRGVTRPQGPACDIGAFELVPYAAQVQQPINPDGSSVFSVKRGVVPVKFTLTYGGVATCQLPPATISLTRTAGGVLGTIAESVYLLTSGSGSNFRIDTANCQYVYNLATSSLGTGTYVVKILIGGSVVGSGAFGLQ